MILQQLAQDAAGMKAVWYGIDTPNMNWLSFLQFVDHNSGGIALLLALFAFFTFALLIVLKVTALEHMKASKKPPIESMRVFTVKDGEAELFSCLACDVDVDEQTGCSYLNFLGPADDKGHRSTVAIYSMTADLMNGKLIVKSEEQVA